MQIGDNICGPLIEVSIDFRPPCDWMNIMPALQHLADEDPLFCYEITDKTGTTIIGGTDEEHLLSKIEMLRDRYKFAFTVQAPQIIYRRGSPPSIERCPRTLVGLLEPIMKVEVITPEDYCDWVINDLMERRGQIQGQEARGEVVMIKGIVPLAGMFGYVNSLRFRTEARAHFTMSFDHYASVPLN
jgi:translation elongation factor EF-G